MLPSSVIREQLNSIIRAHNVSMESAERQHQENQRVIEKMFKDVQCSIQNRKAKQSGRTGKRTFSSILRENIEECTPVFPRTSRSAAKVASAKIKTIADTENSEVIVKRRCIVKLERISGPLSTLDIINEEQEIIDSSPEIPIGTTGVSNLVNEVISSAPQLSVHKKSVQDKHCIQLTCATACEQTNLDLEPPCSGGHIDKPESSTIQKSSSALLANSTFVVDAVQSEVLQCDSQDVSNLRQNKTMKNYDHPVETPDVGSELHSTFVIATKNSGSMPNKVVEGKQVEAPLRTPVPEEEKIGKGSSSQKLQKGITLHRNEEVNINLQKLIIESPVRVTRTKTRALAKAAAAAATSTDSSESAQKVTANSIQADRMNSIKPSKKKAKMDNKKEVNGYSDFIISPVFKKPPYKISPEDHMKENYNSSTEKPWKSATKDLNNTSKMKTPLSSNNSLSCSTLQSSKLNVMGTGSIISYCDTFIPKNPAKPVLAQQNQKLQEEKVIEAEKKKERLLKEKAEQQKRNNEARAAKVAKTREKLERQRALQQQQVEREKELRLKTAQQKRDEEVAIKRQIAHQRAVEAEERRKQEEEQFLIGLKKKEKEKEEAERAAEKKALQLKKEAEEQLKAKEAEKIKKEIKVKPLASGSKIIQKSPDLFTKDDIYSGGNSEEEENKEKKIYPEWTSASRVQLQLSLQEMGMPLLLKFFQSEKQTPDLTKIFKTVPAKALVRTSSAVWHTPPCKKF